MKIVTLSSHALLPKKGSVNAAGYDLYSIETGVIKPKERRLIPTGIALAITGLAPDSDTTAVTAGDTKVILNYT